jgi:hypothetical protein
VLEVTANSRYRRKYVSRFKSALWSLTTQLIISSVYKCIELQESLAWLLLLLTRFGFLELLNNSESYEVGQHQWLPQRRKLFIHFTHC